MAGFSRTVFLKADAKMTFQFLTEVEMLPEILPGVHDVDLHSDPPFGVGTQWTEVPARLLGILPRRGPTFTVTTYDKTKRRLVATCGDATFIFEAKKGGKWSCNLHMQVTCEDEKKAARLERRHGDRLDHILAFFSE